MRRPPPRRLDAALAARYQRLVLLNRLSLALFSERPFAEALAEAGHTALALTGARAISIRFADELGALRTAHRHGEKKLSDPEALAAEDEAAAAAAAEQRLVSFSRGGRCWEAAPLLRATTSGVAIEGVVTFGHSRELSSDDERAAAVVEISRHLRNARAIQHALRQQKVYAEVFARAADAAFVADAEGRIVSWNSAAEALFGWTAAEIVGRESRQLVPPGRAEEASDVLAEVRRTGRKAAFETERLRKDGSTVEVEASVAALRDADGKPVGSFCAYRDITKRKELERLREGFSALVVHDLRTPLTAIHGFATLLAEDPEGLGAETARRHLRIIIDETERLSRLVDDFLEVARLESGALSAAAVPVDLAALATRAVELFKENSGKVIFSVRLGPGTGAVRGDAELLHRMLVNLCANALKYSPPGGTVTVSTRREGDFVELAVDDQGPGVAPQDRERLFTKFFRGADEVARKTTGTGLGLAICRGIVEAHGGSIRVEDAPGGGARFVARLPAA